MFADTLVAGSISKRGGECAELFGTYFGCYSALPMQVNSDAHEVFYLLVQHGGGPLACIMDVSKYQVQ